MVKGILAHPGLLFGRVDPTTGRASEEYDILLKKYLITLNLSGHQDVEHETECFDRSKSEDELV